MTDYTQVMPPLSDAEYELLKTEIATRGLDHPIIVDEDGNVIDGHHRQQACLELGVEPRYEVRGGLSEDEKWREAFTRNRARRHLKMLGEAAAAARLLEELGGKRGQGSRNDLTSATVAEVADQLGIKERTLRWRWQVLEKLAGNADLIRKVDDGDMTAREAEREADRRAAADEVRCAVCGAPGEYAIPHPLRILYELPDPLVDPRIIPPPPGVDPGWYCRTHALKRRKEVDPHNEGTPWPLHRGELTAPETRHARLLDLPAVLAGPQGARVTGADAKLALDVLADRYGHLGDELADAAKARPNAR